MTQTVCQHTYTPGALEKIRTHADFIDECLPDPDETFRACDLPDAEWARNTLCTLRATPAIERVEQSVAKHTDWNDPRWVYRVNPDIHILIIDYVESRDSQLPCGHKGLRNEGGALVCLFQGCDEEYSRDDVVRRAA